MIRCAWLSFWHAHAVGTATRNYSGLGAIGKAKQQPGIEIVACWDENVARGRQLAPVTGVPLIEDYDDLLARKDIDAVIVMTSTTLHGQVIKKAAKAGKHIFSGKVLTPTIKEANEVAAAVKEAGVTLTVDLKHICFDYVQRIKQIIDSGVLGTIVNIRMMQCHGMAIGVTPLDNFGVIPDGFCQVAQAGGGALTDICHPVYVLPFLHGMPESVYANFGSVTKKGDVEDNALAIYGYPDGSHASNQASWATLAAPGGLLEVNGTVGSVYFRANSHPSWGAPKDHAFEMRTRDQIHFAPLELGKFKPWPMDQWVERVNKGLPDDENVALALNLSRLTEAANLSAKAGRKIYLSELVE